MRIICLNALPQNNSLSPVSISFLTKSTISYDANDVRRGQIILIRERERERDNYRNVLFFRLNHVYRRRYYY